MEIKEIKFVETPRIKSRRYTVTIGKNFAEISEIRYPLPGWGNNVTTNIRANEDSVEMWETRDNWFGSGSSSIAFVPGRELATFTREKIQEAFKFIEQQEYKKVSEIFKQLEERVVREEKNYW